MSHWLICFDALDQAYIGLVTWLAEGITISILYQPDIQYYVYQLRGFTMYTCNDAD